MTTPRRRLLERVVLPAAADVTLGKEQLQPDVVAADAPLVGADGGERREAGGTGGKLREESRQRRRARCRMSATAA